MERLLGFAQSVFEKTRLHMLKILLERELCVCELAEIFKVSSPRMSQHLQALRRAGVVSERRDGKWVYYSANREAVEAFTRSWQEYLQTDLQRIPQLATEAAALNSEKLKTVREGCDGQGKVNSRLKITDSGSIT